MKTCNHCKKEIKGIARWDKVYSCEDCFQVDYKKRCDIKHKEYLATMEMLKQQRIEEAKSLLRKLNI